MNIIAKIKAFEDQMAVVNEKRAIFDDLSAQAEAAKQELDVAEEKARTLQNESREALEAVFPSRIR